VLLGRISSSFLFLQTAKSTVGDSIADVDHISDIDDVIFWSSAALWFCGHLVVAIIVLVHRRRTIKELDVGNKQWRANQKALALFSSSKSNSNIRPQQSMEADEVNKTARGLDHRAFLLQKRRASAQNGGRIGGIVGMYFKNLQQQRGATKNKDTANRRWSNIKIAVALGGADKQNE
jgi:hypothetical protein